MALTKPTPIRSDIPTKEVQEEAKTGEMVRINFEVDKATRQHWKTEAVKRGQPLAEMLRTAMHEYLSK